MHDEEGSHPPHGLLTQLPRNSQLGRESFSAGPLKGELLGTDQLAERARAVAGGQRVNGRAKRRWRQPLLLSRLTESGKIIHDTYSRLAAGSARGVEVGPAGDWLLDNFHVVQEQIREVRATLPADYYRELPELTSGPLAGYPRVYEMAITLVSHTEARVDLANLDVFVGAFQAAGPLRIGELWAIPAMLRLALIESVRRMSMRTVYRMNDIELADASVAGIKAALEKGPAALDWSLERLIPSPSILTPSFISRLLHQLRLIEGSYGPLGRIEEWIGQQLWASEAATARATQHQALTHVMMANSITSLRTIAHLDWASFVEGQSAVERLLRQDPAGFYPRMTFATRDRYRHVIERIARRTGEAEEAIARRVLEVAEQAAAPNGEGLLAAHLGYHLIDEGLPAFEEASGYRSRPREAIRRWLLQHPNVVLGGGIIGGTVAAIGALLWLAGADARAGWLLIAAIALVPAIDIAIGVVNQLVTSWLPPQSLPKLDLTGTDGIPPEFRTAVVIPTLFANPEAVNEALANLEVQFLANREAHLHFAVLSDFADASAEVDPADDTIVEAAVKGVMALNAQYAPDSNDAFYLFHRPRRWNEQQGVWMGWERKRGKLAEFNHFLRGGARDAFQIIVGEVGPLSGVRYVITLDSDTLLPHDAAPDLVGTLAHPLNRPVYNEVSGRVIRGYGILQPRVDVSLPSAHRSRFAAIFSGQPGVDPYTTAVSDVYQDLYGEGSFTGKGIYDVDAFEQATRGRFPENTLLSHDLVEGSYARAGLASDITVYDDYPARYLTYTRRKHRWIRGDWQLLNWLTSTVAGPDGPEPNRLPLLARWKILDNLRRSTIEAGQMLFFLAGWTFLAGSPLRWTGLGVAAVFAPWILAMALAALQLPMDRSWRAYYAGVARDARVSTRQAVLTLAFLPHQAWVSVDAIMRTLWRLFVSRRLLLEWETASAAERGTSATERTVWRAMSPAVGLAVLSGILIMAWGEPGPEVLTWELGLAVGPLLLLWMASPAIAHALSARPATRSRQLSPGEQGQAVRLALLHWRYFDYFVGDGTQWLVPDNYQEQPLPVVAMRTSPTNMGLHLMSVVSARDLGFIATADMARRLELAFRSLERMRRFRGHFFNWYDLHDLQVLEPAYVSTVDSGNLAGHLLAVRQACEAARSSKGADELPVAALCASLELVVERLRILSTAVVPAREAGLVAGARPSPPRDGSNPGLPASVGGSEAAPVRLESALHSVTEHVRNARAVLDRPSVGSAVDGEEILAQLRAAGVALGRAEVKGDRAAPVEEWLTWSIERLEEHLNGTAAETLAMERLQAISDRALAYVLEMDFRFLFDEERELFSIGYQYSSHSLDPSYYDLFASESRLASFIAIAKNDVPADHWFRLGRTLTRANGETALISWSGSMFEYLMPALVMRAIPDTLLDQTYRGAVRRQISYGRERGVPWGVSESAYNLRDRHLTYQYRAFGVPDLALKRGLGHELVIAPYASALAILVDAHAPLVNLAALERRGTLGPYGFRDSIDYTRPDPGRRYSVVGNYMAHHVGMTLAALTNALTGMVWQERFHADPLIRSAELLLHERIPRRLILQEPQRTRPEDGLPDPEVENPAVREFDQPDSPTPHVALLGRHPYTLMVSHCGGGYSHFEDLAVTRWRADGTRDSTGQFCYVRDVTSGRVWSSAHQPVCAPADSYRALMATDRVTFHRSDNGVETRTEIAVVPEDAAEVRCVTVTNHGTEYREIDLTSYGEIVLGPPDADLAHPAFANLFVETEWHAWCSAITATRRPRSAGERLLWCVHVVNTGPNRVGTVSYETDRARFVGRGRTTREPAALLTDSPLSCTTGSVLDPIFALRARVGLAPGQSASVAFTTLVATTREQAFERAGRYHDAHAAERALDLAWTSQQLELRELGLTSTDAADLQELAGLLIFPLTASVPPDFSDWTGGSQPLLWETGVSGDWPIILATIGSDEGLPTLRQLFTAHHYWRRRGMKVDVVVMNTRAPSYLQELNDRIQEAMFAADDSGVDIPGGVFIRRSDQMSAGALALLERTARLRLRCDGRSIRAALDLSARQEPSSTVPITLESQPRRLESHSGQPVLTSGRGDARRVPDLAKGAIETVHRQRQLETPAAPSARLLFENGIGGLDDHGDYQIGVRGDSLPPAPWVNVIANPMGGFVVSERGAGFSWAHNSYFFRLTPWHNDPVSDPATEVVYLRDEESGELWSATPAPCGLDTAYTIRHGAGVSSFACERRGIATKLTMGMMEGAAVKLSTLVIRNLDVRPRRISVTAYVEWTLGVLREHTQYHVTTSFDTGHRTILARNSFEPQFAEWVAFCAISEAVTAMSGNRRTFLGRNGSLEDPAALRTGGALDGAVGTGLDPCAALQCVIDVGPGESREVTVVVGAAVGAGKALEAIARCSPAGVAADALTDSAARWSERLSVITVKTPEPAFDAMLNRWTLYQALSCRMWARSALYQSSGAYGFRDQLQDVLAFVYCEPGVAREHILRAAGRQFLEGDVQHWWHPQSGRGVRTRFSDDLAWLPYVVSQYVLITGDDSVLDEWVPFLSMRPLAEHEHEVYDLPIVSDEHGTVYEHCLRALRRASTKGAHGLPLMGVGDWNDGMNRVGIEGRGESVWLAWFLTTTLRDFATHARARGDLDSAATLLSTADGYADAAETAGWDGEWYRRAYFDDGTPLGSSTSEECRIDSIAQSWSVISGAGSSDHQQRAMQSFGQHLIREDARLLMLLTPPFDRTPKDPGYIKGYLPGVRENGAQYTHAALWAVLATALRGDGDRAFELYQMLNPLTHTSNSDGVATYKVEPYVVAADVYTAEGQVGRGGWTWYTGSASWMYRVGLESILGFTRRGERLGILPCVPESWSEYTIEYRYGGALYVIEVHPTHLMRDWGIKVTLDGEVLEGSDFPLLDDGGRHTVLVQARKPHPGGAETAPEGR